MSLILSIERKDLPKTFHNLTNQGPMFAKRDIAVTGQLREIFKDSITDVFEDNLKLEYMKNYEIKKVKCNFKKSPTYSTTEISFELFVSDNLITPFPPILRNEYSPEVKKICKEIMEKIAKYIHEEYKIEVDVLIDEWGFGSIEIGGSVFMLHGEFTPRLRADILRVLEEQSQTIPNSSHAVAQELPKSVVDESKVNFTFITVLANPKIVADVKEKEISINKWFMHTLKHQLTNSKVIFYNLEAFLH